MKAYCLASSSAGNCYILEFEIEGVPTRIMVECGIPLSEIYKRASQYEIDLSTIKCCLITHAHGDHCVAAKKLSAMGMPIFAHRGTVALLGLKANEMEDKKPIKVCDGITVMPFLVEHDIEGAVGFVIKTRSNETVIFINDHKRWTCNLSAFKPDYVFIECNYDHKVVYAQVYELKKMEQTKEVKVKLAQHERNLNSHCSLNGTIKGLKKLNLERCKTIFLMHLSDRYASEYRMKIEVQLKARVKTVVCRKLGGFN